LVGHVRDGVEETHIREEVWETSGRAVTWTFEKETELGCEDGRRE
jgi:hypothetical protein